MRPHSERTDGLPPSFPFLFGLAYSLSRLASLLACLAILCVNPTSLRSATHEDVADHRGVRGRSEAGNVRSVNEYANLRDEEISITQGVLAVEVGLRPMLSKQLVLDQLGVMSTELRRRIGAAHGPDQIVKVLRDYLFHEQGFAPAVNHSFLGEVISQRRGDCFGLSLLYLCLAEKLQLPLYGVTAGNHMFVRYVDAGKVVNIETTLNGRSFPDSYFIESTGISRAAITNGVYMRNMNKKEVLAVCVNSRGVRSLSRASYAAAIKDFSIALRLDHESVSAYANRSVANNDVGNHNQALRDCIAALSLDPEDAKLYSNRANVYEKQGKVRQALRDLDRAVLLDPNFAGAYLNRGNIYGTSGEMDKALQNYDAAVRLSPDFRDAYFGRGAMYLMVGKTQKAVEDFSKVISLDPNDSRAYNWRAMAFSEIGRKQGALEDLKKAVRLNPAIKAQIKEHPAYDRWRNDREFMGLLK